MYQSARTTPKRSVSRPRHSQHQGTPKSISKGNEAEMNKPIVDPKINTLRNEVDKRVKEMKGSRVDSGRKEVKETKPKIRLISEKQSIVEETTQNILGFATALANTDSAVQKRSTFYKNIETIQEEQADLPKPMTQAQRRKSTSLMNLSLRKSLLKPNIQPDQSEIKLSESPSRKV